MEGKNKIPAKEVRTLFFDYDGTLHDSLKIYARAFQKAYGYLVKQGLAPDREWSGKEISYWLGFNAKDMWQNFMPDLGTELRQYCSSLIGREMREQIEQGEPVLYEGALETLSYLKQKGYYLVFISNCNFYYLESHRKLFHLDKYFDQMICSEEYEFLPKQEIISFIKNKYLEKMAIIGDRKQDMDAGKKNGLYTIGCQYGYAFNGELDGADIYIDSIKELVNIF